MNRPPGIVGRIPASMLNEQSDPLLVGALKIAGAVQALGANYAELMERAVFPHPRVEIADQKLLKKHKRCLMDDEAHQLLLIIWKESQFISDVCLASAGLKREFPLGTINAWALAVRLSAGSINGAGNVGKLNNRIRTIGIAAEAFGLLERIGNANSVKLEATEHLHKFMMSLAENNRRILRDIMSLLDVTQSEHAWVAELDGGRHERN